MLKLYLLEWKIQLIRIVKQLLSLISEWQQNTLQHSSGVQRSYTLPKRGVQRIRVKTAPSSDDEEAETGQAHWLIIILTHSYSWNNTEDAVAFVIIIFFLPWRRSDRIDQCPITAEVTETVRKARLLVQTGSSNRLTRMASSCRERPHHESSQRRAAWSNETPRPLAPGPPWWWEPL